VTAAVGAVVGAGINAYEQHKAGELGFNAKSISRIAVEAGTGALAGSGLGGLGVAVAASVVGEVADQKISKGKVSDPKKVLIGGVITAATGGIIKGGGALATKTGIVASSKNIVASKSTVSVLSNVGKTVLTSNSRQNIKSTTTAAKSVADGIGNIVSYISGNKAANALSQPKEKTKSKK
jgi:hypothetical protein